MSDAATLYQGEQGAHYYAQRAKSRSASSQVDRAHLFDGLTDETNIVLDFGCGSGGVLALMPARKRIGVDVSSEARADAAKVLDEVFASMADVPNASVDCIMSYHALEHVSDPGGCFDQFVRVLRPGGRLRVIVPCDNPLVQASQQRWEINPDNHLFSWTPMTLGNLATSKGLRVDDALMGPGSTFRKLSGGSVARALSMLKSVRSGKFNTIVTATKPHV